MELERKELELAAVGISIAAGCIPCTRYHVDQARRMDAAPEAILRAAQTGATIAGAALKRTLRIVLEEAGRAVPEADETDTGRQFLLGAIGSAVAGNDVEQLRSFVHKAKSNGISDHQIMEIVGLATRIKEKAASHLASVINTLEAEPAIADNAATLCN